jgi:uncharacterized membrane protein (UPF0127 family)
VGVVLALGCRTEHAALPAAGAPAPAPAAAVGAARPAWVYLYAGSTEIRAEVAATPSARQVGLMHRRSLEPDSGMVFVFPDRRELDFWMLNVPIPLSIAFLDDDGTIVRVHEMPAGDGVPAQDQTRYRSAAAVRLALEMEAGWFTRHGLKEGDKLDLGTLLEDVKPSE